MICNRGMYETLYKSTSSTKASAGCVCLYGDGLWTIIVLERLFESCGYKDFELPESLINCFMPGKCFLSSLSGAVWWCGMWDIKGYITLILSKKLWNCWTSAMPWISARSGLIQSAMNIHLKIQICCCLGHFAELKMRPFCCAALSDFYHVPQWFSHTICYIYVCIHSSRKRLCYLAHTHLVYILRHLEAKWHP